MKWHYSFLVLVVHPGEQVSQGDFLARAERRTFGLEESPHAYIGALEVARLFFRDLEPPQAVGPVELLLALDNPKRGEPTYRVSGKIVMLPALREAEAEVVEWTY